MKNIWLCTSLVFIGTIHASEVPISSIHEIVDNYSRERDQIIKQEIKFQKIVNHYLDKGCPIDGEHTFTASESFIEECKQLSSQIHIFLNQLQIRHTQNEALLNSIKNSVNNNG